ncbi:uncharacterized protein JCM6883_000139 [Sporobolomyces salmoneus]|uniref:uncharacterized protein n=1 Tax=Sporobolomyces salmoneus TaxID=183962 RepID=UPI0031742349
MSTSDAQAEDVFTPSSQRLVAAHLRFVQLSREKKLRNYELQATRRAQENIVAWNTFESGQDKRARLEERLEEVKRELQIQRSKRAIAQGSIWALDHSLLVNSHLQSVRDPPLPSRHALLQKEIVERDQLSFRLLAIQQDLAKVDDLKLQSRVDLLSTTRQNADIVEKLRKRYRPSSKIVQSATGSLASQRFKLEDEILLLQTRLSIISPVLQALISESSLPYFSPNPSSPEALRAQLDRSSSNANLAVEEDKMDTEKETDNSNERWMGLMLLAGEDWNAEWDPLVEGKGMELGVVSEVQ